MKGVHEFPQIRGAGAKQLPPGIRPNALRARSPLPAVRVVEVKESPSWVPWAVAIVTAATIGTALWFGVSDFRRERDEALNEAIFWREMALAPERATTIRLQPDGEHFKCSRFHIRPEWEAMVAAECAVMGELLRQASDTN